MAHIPAADVRASNILYHMPPPMKEARSWRRVEASRQLWPKFNPCWQICSFVRPGFPEHMRKTKHMHMAQIATIVQSGQNVPTGIPAPVTAQEEGGAGFFVSVENRNIC